jgi:hypothetical protein
MSNFMDSYVDVAERIRKFKEQYPTGCLRPYNPDIPFVLMEIGGREFIVYTAACYRTPDDPMPAVAVAAEPSIGKTSFTKDSEVMNAETSAWGRAIVACLAADTQKIASADEVRNRQSSDSLTELVKPNTKSVPPAQPAQRQATGVASVAQIKYAKALKQQVEADDKLISDLTNGTAIDKLNSAQAKQLINDLLALKNDKAILVFNEQGKATLEHTEGNE